jgi:ankyrin repeat protein
MRDTARRALALMLAAAATIAATNPVSAQTRSRGPALQPPPQAPEAADPYSTRRFGAERNFGAGMQDDLDLPIDAASRIPDSIPALHKHIETGKIDLAKRLADDSQIDVNQAIDDGRTPLIRAAFNGHADMVKHLLGNPRVKVLLADDLGYNALHVAAWRGHANVLKVLLKDGRIDPLAMTNPTVTRGNPTFNTGRSRDVVDSEYETEHAGSSAIMLAASSGHNKAVRALIRSGRVDLEQTRAGQHILHMAAFNGHAAVVKTLLDVGVDVNMQTTDGATALWLAAHEGHTGVLAVLLATKGVNMKQGTKEGSPLAMANWMQREEVVQMILEAYGKKPKAGPAERARQQALTTLFSQLDASGDKTLSAKELGPALTHFRKGEETSAKALGAFDNDGKYGLSQSELGHYIGGFVRAKTGEAQAFGDATYDESVETLGPKLGATFASVVEEFQQATKKLSAPEL